MSAHAPISPALPARVILALVVGRQEQARLVGSLRGAFHVVCEASLARFRETLAEHVDRVAAVVIEPTDQEGLSATPFLAQLRQSMPQLSVIGYCRFPSGSSHDLMGFARSGVHEVIFRSLDDEGVALRAALASAEQNCAADRVMRRLRGVLQPDVLEIIDIGVTQGRRPLDVERVADSLGVHRRTLLNRCRRANLPSPAFLLGWCRLFLAASLLEVPGSTVERVAMQLDFPSVTALRNSVRRYSGVTATEVRRLGGLEYLIDRFVSVARGERSAALAFAGDRTDAA